MTKLLQPSDFEKFEHSLCVMACDVCVASGVDKKNANPATRITKKEYPVMIGSLLDRPLFYCEEHYRQVIGQS